MKVQVLWKKYKLVECVSIFSIHAIGMLLSAWRTNDIAVKIVFS